MGTQTAIPRTNAIIATVFGGYATALTALALCLGFDGIILISTLSALNAVAGFFFGNAYMAKRLSPPEITG